MSVASIAKHLPRDVVQIAVESAVTLQSRRNDNHFRYSWNGHNFDYVYPDSRSFAYFRNAIDTEAGVTVKEQVPLEQFECPDHVDGIVDAGAHFGLYSVILGVLNPNTPIISYEPSPYNAPVLRENIAFNGLNNATVREAVVNGGGGSETLVQPTPVQNENRFYENTVANSIHLDSDDSEGWSTEVDGDRLSSVFDEQEWDNPFVKVDVEGAEHEVMRDLLDADLETLQGIVEIHPVRLPKDEFGHEILFWLEREGFDFGCLTDRNPSQAAYWFSNAD